MSKRASRRALFPSPAGDADPSHAYQELQRRFDYFDRGASGNRLVYHALRSVVLIAGALIPIVALATSNDVLVAALGATIAVAEGTTQLTQVHSHWIRYRRTAEALRREAFAYVSGIPPYDTREPDREQTLAARVLDVLSDESSHWEETIRSATAIATSGTTTA